MRRTLLMIMAVALLLTQCRKPAVELPTAEPANTVSMTVTAGPGSKTDITTAGGITWSTGDKLYVGDGSKYIGYLTIVSGQNTPTGTFSGDVTLTGITEGTPHTFGFYYLGSAERTLTVGATTADVDFSSQEIYAEDGNLKNASKHHVGYGSASGTVKDGVVTGINVTLVSKVALARFSFKKGGTGYSNALTLSGTHIYNKMTVNFNSSTGFSFSGTKGDIALGSGNAERYVMLVPVGTGSETLSFAGEGFEGSTTLGSGIEPNKFYGREVAIEVKPVEFTVDANDTKVKFSPGNLQYLGKSDGTGTWRFAEHQWDILGAGPSATSYKGNVDLGTDYTGKYNTGSGSAGGSETSADKAAARDLFGWGTTGNKDTRNSTYQKNYKPYSTSTSNVNTTRNKYGYGPDYDANEYGLLVAAESDWGCVEGLPSAGDGKKWRTLSIAEWAYLLNTDGSSGRTDANRFAKARVNDVNGMLIFPDGYSGTASGDGIAALNTTSAAYPSKNITDGTWASLETAGVVFLPAAGARMGSSLYYVGSGGYYWSSSCNSSMYARSMYFSSSKVSTEDLFARYYGYEVRLVR